jgi:hypothetical protein
MDKKAYFLFILFVLGIMTMTSVHAEEDGFFARVVQFFRATPAEPAPGIEIPSPAEPAANDVGRNDAPIAGEIAQETGPVAREVGREDAKPGIPLQCSPCRAIVCKSNDHLFLCPHEMEQCKERFKECEVISCAPTSCARPTCDGAYDTGEKDGNSCPIYKCPGGTCSKPTCDGVYDTGKMNGECPIYACPVRACKIPDCDGVIDTGQRDDNNCPMYACPAVPEPGSCSMNGRLYKPGENFPSGDGCNTCTCTENGRIACTLRACETTTTRT